MCPRLLHLAAECNAHTYDVMGRLTSVTDPQSQTTTYRYDPVGLLLETALPNGVTTTYGYDAAYRPTNIVHNLGAQTLGSYAYSYDAAGNRMQVTEFNGTVVAWTYDDAYRLFSETRNGSTTSYTYDATGNRLSMTEGGVTTRYVYDALDQLLCTTTGTDCAAGVITSYDYDGRGNLVEESTGGLVTRYTFDARDRLVAVDDGTNALTYTYDAGGRRISEDLNGTVTHYRWDEYSPYGDIVVETDGSGAVTASYVLANGKLIAQTRDGVTGYYLPDAQGSTRALTDSSGAVVEVYDYAAFGELLQDIPDPLSAYLYTGQRYDTATAQYYLRAREYDPAVGRFLSRDTWAVDTWNPVELNRYVYATANPVTWSDPSGRMAVEVATLETKVTLEDLVILGLLGYATTCVYYFTYISILQVAGFDVSFVRALAPDGCEPPERDRDRNRRDCDPMVDEACACDDENSPLYDKNKCEEPCNPGEFIKWWFSLPAGQSGNVNQDWYRYEQRVARANGAYGTTPRNTGSVNADGIEPSSCCLVDAKFIQNPDWYENLFMPIADMSGYQQDVHEFRRYRLDIERDNGWPSAQPKGLIIKISHGNASRWYTSAVRDAGFIDGNGTVVIVP